MDFEVIFSGIKDFYEDNIDTYLTAVETAKSDSDVVFDLDAPDKIVIDVFDAEKYTQKTVVYIQPDDFIFSPLSNDSEWAKNSITNIVTFRGLSSDKLIIKALRYLEAFRNMIRDNSNLGGIVDSANISEAHLYANVEGSSGVSAIEFVLSIENEVD